MNFTNSAKLDLLIKFFTMGDRFGQGEFATFGVNEDLAVSVHTVVFNVFRGAQYFGLDSSRCDDYRKEEVEEVTIRVLSALRKNCIFTTQQAYSLQDSDWERLAKSAGDLIPVGIFCQLRAWHS